MTTVIRCFLLLSAIVTVLASCAKPYDVPSFDAGGKPLLRTDAEVAFGGIASHLNHETETRVFWMHGMCSHGATWVSETSDTMRAALRAVILQSIDKEEPIDGSYTWTIPLATPRGDLRTTFYIWSPLTENLKQLLDFDNTRGGGFQYQRAPLNETLKAGLLNDCLADAVIVSGSNGDAIAFDTRKRICTFLGGRLIINDDDPLNSRECYFSADEETASPRVLVAESLGSKLMADAVSALIPTKGQETRFNKRLASIKQVFLLANQIPILNLADTQVAALNGKPTSQSSSLHRMLSALRSDEILSTDNVTKIPVIAFTDPNDLLSYRLTNAHIDPQRATLVNVLVSNDWTYFPTSRTIGLERPDTAHCDYVKNLKVLSMVAVGNPGTDGDLWDDVAKRVDIDSTNGCGF